MHFRLESYDARRSAWDYCTLFRDDFAACQTPEEAQTLLDRVDAAYSDCDFRVRYDSVMAPRLNTASPVLKKSYELQFWSAERNSWNPSGLVNVDMSKCQGDGAAFLLLGQAKKLIPDIKYRVEVTTGESGFAKYIIE